jgi:hypothetical protein
VYSGDWLALADHYDRADSTRHDGHCPRASRRHTVASGAEYRRNVGAHAERNAVHASESKQPAGGDPKPADSTTHRNRANG